MKLVPEREDTYKGSTHGGWTYQATLIKYDRYMVEVSIFDPSGKAFGKPQKDCEGSYSTLDEAKRAAETMAFALTPEADDK